MLMGRGADPGTLGHIKKLDNSKADLITQLVLGDMGRLNWVEFYGLNYKETMDLEFSEYLVMIKHLEKHSESVAKASVVASDQVLNSFEKGK